MLRPFHNSALPAKTKKEKGANGYGKPCAVALKKNKKSPFGYNVLFEDKSRDTRIKYTSLPMNAA